MNLEDLRAAQVDERGTDSLQPLPATFYEQAADYLAGLRTRRDRVADRADDPFGSDAVRQLTDELETAEEVVEALYERRVGKIVKQASLAAAGMPADDDGLTEEEQVLFADLVDRIESHRQSVLAVLAEGGDDPPDGPESADTGTDVDTPDAPDAARAAEPASGSAADEAPTELADEPSADDAAGGEPDRLTVRMTADVGEIYGVDDRVYTLGAEDVVTLPAANAEPLLDRGAAKRVE